MEQKTEASQAVEPMRAALQEILDIEEIRLWLIEKDHFSHVYWFKSKQEDYAARSAGLLDKVRAALKAQPAPTEAELARQAGELHAYYMSGTTPDDLADNLYRAGFNDCRNGREYDPASSPAWGEVKSAIEVTTEAAQGNTSNNSSSSQLSGNSGELANKQVHENIEQVQGEDSARLADGYKSSTMVSDFYGPKVTLHYETTAQADAAHDTLVSMIEQASAETGGVKP